MSVLLDTFLYNGEKDILELRYETLKDRVDFFLGVYGSLTFTGLPNEIEPLELPRIAWLKVDTFPEASPRNPWKREMWQRNQILNGIGSAMAPDDLVMVSDVDEIPDPKDIPETLELGELIRFQHEFYHFNFNNHVIRDDSAKKGWSCTALCCVDNLFKWYPQGVRNQIPARIIRSGWHFSWFWKPEEKLTAYSHIELQQIEGSIPQKVQQRWEYQYEKVKGLKHLPQPVQENPERWSHYFDPAYTDLRHPDL